MTDRRFGISTHLFHESRLAREHLVHIAGHGFDALELFATRSHFDYYDDAAIAELATWLSDTGLELHSVHAPIFERLKNGQWMGAISNAASDELRRAAAVKEAQAALALARRIPYRFLVVHLGVPAGAGPSARDNDAAAARRSLEETADLAAAAGVRVAVEVIPNPLSDAESLVRLIEDEVEGVDVGICFDYGHAHLMGDVPEAIETVSGYLCTTHVHDNRGRDDEHLVPFAGTIDWDVAMMATQKIGYEGVLMFEVGSDGDPVDVLTRTAAARARLEQSFIGF